MRKCYLCKQIKPISEFYPLGVRCKICDNKTSSEWRTKNKVYRRKYIKDYRKRKPWMGTLFAIKSRCENKSHDYYKKGIKNYLTAQDLKYLWFRDKAYLMKSPSIDRLDVFKDYTLENSHYIELKENLSKKKHNGRWALHYDDCIECNRTDRPYGAHGRCKTCYARVLKREKASSVAYNRTKQGI